MKNYKNDFPIFKHHPNLVYLDSGASALKPRMVLETVKTFCETSYANIHRGLYPLSITSTEAVENARKKVAHFFGTTEKNLCFTKNATEGSNIVANGLFEYLLEQNESFEIMTCMADHHANFVPWLHRCNKHHIKMNIVSPNEDGIFSAEDFINAVQPTTKVMVLPHVSNVTGQIFPIETITKNIPDDIFVIVDMSQSAPHLAISFDNLKVDAGFFTGHKLGAGGVGGLMLSRRLASILPPLLLGGDIVTSVTTTEYHLINAPEVFESGTPPIENIVGLGAAIDYIASIGGMEMVRNHEKKLIAYTIESLTKYLPQWNIIGPTDENQRSGNVTIGHSHIHHEDVGMILAENNICVRTGFHCAHPLHACLKSGGTVRLSFWIYTTIDDIDQAIAVLQKAEKMLQ